MSLPKQSNDISNIDNNYPSSKLIKALHNPDSNPGKFTLEYYDQIDEYLSELINITGSHTQDMRIEGRRNTYFFYRQALKQHNKELSHIEYHIRIGSEDFLPDGSFKSNMYLKPIEKPKSTETLEHDENRHREQSEHPVVKKRKIDNYTYQ